MVKQFRVCRYPAINRIAGSRRLLTHTVFTPKTNGWMNEVDRAIATLKPDSWKGYTIGDNTVRDTAGTGISQEQTTGGTVTGNRVRGTTGSGIACTSCSEAGLVVIAGVLQCSTCIASGSHSVKSKMADTVGTAITARISAGITVQITSSRLLCDRYMAFPPRRRETMHLETVYRRHPMFADAEFPIWYGGGTPARCNRAWSSSAS